MTYALLTRDPYDAAHFAHILPSLGMTPILEPMITTHIMPSDLYRLVTLLREAPAPDAFIITSKHALRAVDARRSVMPDSYWHLPLYAVGEETALMARMLGFTKVIAGDGSAASLVPLVASYTAERSHLYYLSGDVIAQEFTNAQRIVLYRTRARGHFSKQTERLLREGLFSSVWLYSKRAASLFLRLLDAAHLTSSAATIHARTLTPAIADLLASYPFASVRAAATPSSDSMLELAHELRLYRS